MTVFFLADCGSGDGSHASFSLATRLQEIVEISRALSLHDEEAEKAEKDAFMEQIDALQEKLDTATEAASKAEAEVNLMQERLLARDTDVQK